MRSGPLRRDTYVKLPEGVEKGNIARKLLKPLYGMSTACKDWYGAIRNFLANECGGEVTSLDKSVFFRTRQWSDYGYGKGFRDLNNTNLDKCVLKRTQIAILVNNGT